MAEPPALQPQEGIGVSMRAIAARILAHARATITDPERSGQDAVHDFRRAMKEWRALMRLLAPLVAEAEQRRIEARDHARSLALARDGQAALNALDDLVKNNLVPSQRTAAAIRAKIEALRANEEKAVLTPQLRDSIVAWLDDAAAAVAQWPLDELDFAAVAAQLTAGYRRARRRLPADWAQATAEDVHGLRRRVVDHRYQMQWVEPLWPRFVRVWVVEAERLRDRLGKCQDLVVLERLTGPHQPLARWRSRLIPACDERRAALRRRAARIAGRLFAERPKAFRRRLETLWHQRG